MLIRKIEEYGLHDFDTGRRVAGVPSDQVASVPKTVSDPRAAATFPATDLATHPGYCSTRCSCKDGRKRLILPLSGRLQQRPQTTQTTREAEAPIKVISLGAGKNIQENNGVEYIIAEAGDTFESLADKYQLLSWEISRYNDLAPGTTLQPGQIIYLQPKRTRASEEYSIHTVIAGETMHGISQKYAVKLSSLYKMNVMEEGSECKPGQKLRIR